MIVPNDNSRVLLLENKKADIIENPPGNLIGQIETTPGLQTYLFPSTRVDFIQLDQHYAPFKNPKVREALNYAIDRNAIVKLAYQGMPRRARRSCRTRCCTGTLAQADPYDRRRPSRCCPKVGYPTGSTPT